MQIKQQHYKGKADNQRIRNFLSNTFAATKHPYFTTDLPNWERISTTIRLGANGPDIHLWSLTDQIQQAIVGMVLYKKHQNEFSYLVHPDYREIEVLLCEWAENEFINANYTQLEQNIIHCSVCEQNETQKITLSHRGYVKVKLTTIFRKRQLTEVLPKPNLSSGYSIHSIQALATKMLKQRATVENQIFGRNISVKFLQELQQTPIYRSELDLVVTTPTGTLAGFCAVWLDEVNKVGFIEPIGILPDHQQRGLAKALMQTGFQKLQQLGANWVYLGHSAANLAGNRLYDSVGMSIFDQEYLWTKEF